MTRLTCVFGKVQYHIQASVMGSKGLLQMLQASKKILLLHHLNSPFYFQGNHFHHNPVGVSNNSFFNVDAKCPSKLLV